VTEKEPAALSWLDPRVVVKASPIHGSGLFVTAPFGVGDLLLRFGGRLIADATMKAIAAGGAPFSAYRIGRDAHLLMAQDDPASRGNHACDPNAWLSGAFRVVARRPISAGEEITLDYATLTVDRMWHMDCRCGSPLCVVS
jgi:hypothetical protein